MTSQEISVGGAASQTRRFPNHRGVFLLALGVIDAVMLILAFSVAFLLRFQFGLTVRPEVTPAFQDYVVLIAVLLPAWLGIFYAFRLYDYRFLLGGTAEYSRVFNACTVGMLLVILFTFANETVFISRAWVLMSWAFSFLFVTLGRILMRRLAYSLRSHGYFVARAVIVGRNEEARALAAQLLDTRFSGVHLIGFIDGEGKPNEPRIENSLPVLGSVNEAVEIIRLNSVEEVIVATTALHREQLLPLFEQLAVNDGVQVRLSSGLYEIMTTGVQVHPLGSVPLMSLSSLRLDPVETALKAILDYTMILASAILWLPLVGVLSIAIKLDSPGPAIYRRRVLGVGGKQFDAYKFRTMFTNGDEILAQYPDLQAELNANHKLKDDPRVTRVGKWLRKTSLDELPQLFNVLKGQMSLVGPRMIHPSEAKEFGKYSLNLLTVKPGLTGLWQVSGRSDLSYQERVRLDMHYIRNYSIWLDLQILLFQTIPAVVRRRGAY